jgi:hypothetical protein
VPPGEEALAQRRRLVLLIGVAETGRVYDGVEGPQQEEDEEDGERRGDGGAYGEEDRLLLDLLPLAAVLGEGATRVRAVAPSGSLLRRLLNLSSMLSSRGSMAESLELMVGNGFGMQRTCGEVAEGSDAAQKD